MNADDPSIGIDNKQLVQGVKESERALDSLLATLQTLDRSVASMGTRAASALQKANAAYAALNKSASNAFVDSQQLALDSMAKNNFTGLKLVKDQNAALQGLYEARLATAGRLSNSELQVWKNYGASLGKIQAAQLKGWELSALSSNVNGAGTNTKDRLMANLGNLGADNSPLGSIRARSADDSAVVLSLMNKFYGDTERILNKLGAMARLNSPLGSIRQSTPEDSAMILNGMQKFYADQERILNKLGILAQDNSPLRSIRKTLSTDSAVILGEMRKFYAEQEALSKASSLRAAEAAVTSRRGGGASTALLALRNQYSNGGDAGMEALRVAKDLERVDEAAKKAGKGAAELSGGFKRLASDGNDVHSMARGLASGFGLLWLTWGNLAPLFIGAAISNAFVQTAKSGMAVAHTLAIIANVGGNTRTEMALLNEGMLEMARSGPFGPLEVAEAMKTLSLAGLKANEILMVTKDVLNFSVAGTTDLKTAADNLMAISTAFGLGVAGFSRVSDIVSKAAAESMTSVESFGNAMKTASVINAQYGVSLEDTATGLAALSQLGIQGTAAGTALRNMYADLSGRSMQVAKVLRQQGIELRDATGAFRPMIEVVAQLNDKFNLLDGISQKNLMQALLSERGAKGIVEMLRLINSEAKNMGSGLSNALEEMRQSIGDAEGFAAITAAKMAQTAENQFKQVKSVLLATMSEVYTEMEPSLLLIADGLKRAFASEEFKSGLRAMVTGIAELGRMLVDNAKLISTLAVGYGLLKVAQMATVSVLGALNSLSAYRKVKLAEEAAAVAALTLAENGLAAAKTRTAATSATVLARLGTLARFVPIIGTAVSVASLAWMAYDFWMGESNDTGKQATELYNNNIIKDLNDQAKKLNALNALREEGLTLQEAEIKLQLLAKNGGALAQASKIRADADVEYQNSSLSPEARTRVYAARIQQANALTTAVDKENAAVQKSMDGMREAARWKQSLDDRDQQMRLANQQKAGEGLFQLGDSSSNDRGNGRAASALESIIEREKERAAALAESSMASSELGKIEITRIKNLVELESRYANATKESKGANAEQLKALKTDYGTAKQLIVTNAARERALQLIKEENEEVGRLYDARQKEIDSLDELSRTRFLSLQALKKEGSREDEDVALENRMRYATETERRIEEARLKVRREFADRKEKLELEYGKAVAEATSEGQARRAKQELDRDLSGLSQEEHKALSRTTAQIYRDEWDKTSSTIASNLTSEIMNGTLDAGDFLKKTFADMVLQPQLEMLMKGGVDMLGNLIMGGGIGGGGGGGGIWGSLLSGIGGFLGFEGGGYTGTGPRSGGMDGRGGFLAMVHPDESVIDHTKSGGGSGGPVYVTIHNTVGDVATKSMLEQSNKSTIAQIQGGLGRSMRYNGALS